MGYGKEMDGKRGKEKGVKEKMVLGEKGKGYKMEKKKRENKK